MMEESNVGEQAGASLTLTCQHHSSIPLFNHSSDPGKPLPMNPRNLRNPWFRAKRDLSVYGSEKSIGRYGYGSAALRFRGAMLRCGYAARGERPNSMDRKEKTAILCMFCSK
jgi:hypothetical protein